MKTITDSAVYIQKKDIIRLSKANIAIPTTIFIKAFGNEPVIINDSNKYEFVKFDEFDKPEEREFFYAISWMINYNEAKDLSELEISELGQSILHEKNIIAKKLSSLSLNDKKERINLLERYTLLDLKMSSLIDILWFKQGKIKAVLPEETEIFRKNM